jgi:ATP-binding cassette, subfamily B, bacterial
MGASVSSPMAGSAGGRPLGPDGPPLGRPPGLPAGGAIMGGPGGGMAGTPPPSMDARPYIRRSLSLLSAFKGAVTGLIVLGLIATLLPFVASAALGPLIQLMGLAVAKGNLHFVWGLKGPLFSRADASTSGPLGWLAVPLHFAVLLTIWSGSLVLAQVLSFLRSWINARVEWKLLTNIRQRVHDHLQSLSLDFFTGERSGSLMQRVLFEAMGVQRLLTECLIPPSIDVVVLVIVLIYMLALSWQMTIVALILSPVTLITLRFAGKRLQAATQRMMMSNRLLGGELDETISGIDDIQVFNAQPYRSERFHEASDSAAKQSALMKVWITVSGNTAQIFVALSTALVLILGVMFSDRFNLSLAALVVFVNFVPNMYAPVSRIIQAYTTYESIAPNIFTTYELLDTKPTVEEHPDAEDLGEVHGNIVFDDVVFGYSPHQKTLDGLSLSIKEGETVALVGPIGCGKSTTLNLHLRFIDPERGRISLDGHDISRVTLRSLREQVSKLSQFPFFMKDTIRENVRMGRHGASDAEVEEACKLAHIHEVIVDPNQVPLGYDTVVDVQVPSGGQKRLIAMARCLLRKPEVLLLDEPTENLDVDQRARLTRTIRDYAADRTCIVISHDMDFVAAVSDLIIVLHDGRVAEQGTHDQLLAAGGLYRKLYEAQNVDPSHVRGATPPSGASAAKMVGASSMPHP